MHSFVASSAILASTLFSTVHAFGPGKPSGGQNVAVYWGQGSNQNSLASFCTDSTIDIIPLAFMNVFPDQNGTYGYPGTSFGNACGGYYIDSKGETTQLLGSCPQIEVDIKYCQSQGKKILLSLGGSSTSVFIASDDSAVAFGDFLHGAFGPTNTSWTGPRPFGDACVDGFDFDIEASASAIPTPLGAHYATMVNHLRTLGIMMITAAPQCVTPDANLGDALKNAYFDAIFVQFYNTPQCSARAYFDNTYGAYGGPATDISYDSWITWMQSNAKNPNALVYLGLPAAPGATFGEMYLNTTEAQEILTYFQGKYPDQFGGAMVWEATFSENNQVNGKSYAANIKSFLTGNTAAPTTSSTTTSSTTTSWTTTWTPTNSATGTSFIIPTFSPSGSGGFPGSSSATGSGYPSPTNSVVTATDRNGNTFTYTPTNIQPTASSPTSSITDFLPTLSSPTNWVVTTTDRNGNAYTYTPTNIQPTAATSSTTSDSAVSATAWPDWDTNFSTVSPIWTSTSSSATWPTWNPSTTASPVASSTGSTSWGEWAPATSSTSSISYQTTITASGASTITVMPLPASSTSSTSTSSSSVSIGSWSSFWTQRASFSHTASSSTPAAPAATSSTSAAWSFAGWGQQSSVNTVAPLPSVTPSAWSFAGWGQTPSDSTVAPLAAATSAAWASTGWSAAASSTTLAPLPSIATVTANAATSAGAVGASGWSSSSAAPSLSVYIQPSPFTGAGSVGKPVFGLFAAVLGGALVMLM